MGSQVAADQTTTTGAQAIRRAIDVVRLVAQIQRSGANLSRVAGAAGLSTSTAFRILQALTEERLLRYDHAERCYYVGPLAFELGLAASAETRVPTRWRDAVDRIARETRLTTYLMARSDRDAVCLLCAQGTTALRAMPMEVGQRLPLGVGAGSLAILATLDDSEVQRIVTAQALRLELFPDGKARPERILKAVEITRREGFAVSSGVVASGTIGVGVVLPPGQGLTQLALSVSAVASTINPTELGKIASVIAAFIESSRI